MNLTMRQNKLLGALSFYPLIYATISLISFVGVFVTIDRPNPIIRVVIDILSYLEIPSLLLLVALILGYLKIIFKTEFKTGNKQMDWAAAIVFFSIFSIPLFWFRYIRTIETKDITLG